MNGMENKNFLAVAVFLLFTITACPAIHAGSEQHCAISLAQSCNDFGAALIKNLEPEDNLLISPLSIFNALLMVYIGAEGNTASQMSNALQLEESELMKSEFSKAFLHLLTVIITRNDDYELNLVNGIFVQQEYEVDKTYISKVQTYYDAILKTVDFANKGKEATDLINNYVSQNTNDKIQTFFQEPLDPATTFAVVSAIYFKGIWKTQFPVENSMDGVFNKNDGSTKTVKFMTWENAELPFFFDDSLSYTFLSLPYKGEDVSMLLALPSTIEVPPLDMTSDLLCTISRSFNQTELEFVTIPKFKMSYESGLVDVLQKMGVVDLFGSADLTGIRSEGDLSLSTLVHKSVIEISEEGSEEDSEAVAAMNAMSARQEIPSFMANYPFSFYIIENRNKLILLSGRVSDP